MQKNSSDLPHHPVSKCIKPTKTKTEPFNSCSKTKYYDTKFESAKNDLRTTWKLLNEVINKRKSKSPLPAFII